MAKEVKTKEVGEKRWVECQGALLFGTEGLMDGKGTEGGCLTLNVKGQGLKHGKRQ